MWWLLIILYLCGLALVIAFFRGASLLGEEYDRRSRRAFSRHPDYQPYQQLELILPDVEDAGPGAAIGSYNRRRRRIEPIELG